VTGLTVSLAGQPENQVTGWTHLRLLLDLSIHYSCMHEMTALGRHDTYRVVGLEEDRAPRLHEALPPWVPQMVSSRDKAVVDDCLLLVESQPTHWDDKNSIQRHGAQEDSELVLGTDIQWHRTLENLQDVTVAAERR
jgi:hypothetical protein